jgi:CDP-6-deoxy-D-xylo-4-hexulose-3-dehydrase
MIRIKPDAPFSRTELAKHLDEHKIGNRMFFGGNLLRQPVFVHLLKDRPNSIRMAKPLKEFAGADEIMNHSLFLGTYPGLTSEMLKYMIDVIQDFAKSSNTP